jgi:hypothetical protein
MVSSFASFINSVVEDMISVSQFTCWKPSSSSGRQTSMVIFLIVKFTIKKWEKPRRSHSLKLSFILLLCSFLLKYSK